MYQHDVARGAGVPTRIRFDVYDMEMKSDTYDVTSHVPRLHLWAALPPDKNAFFCPRAYPLYQSREGEGWRRRLNTACSLPASRERPPRAAKYDL